MFADAQAVLDFWFLPAGDAGHGAARREWFRKDAQFDAQIRERFGALIELALAGDLRAWEEGAALPALAFIVLLDQFTRNAYRGTPLSFAGDTLALRAARRLVATGAELALMPQQRTFVYLPFEHAEDIATQRESVALFTRLAAAQPGFESTLDYAHRHCAIIERFGRFPHRNDILGRASTPEELAFLQQPGSGF